MLNQIQIMGRLTRDPELRHTDNGVAVASFTLAVERDIKSDENRITDFIDVVAWRNTGEFVCNYFQKGRMAIVAGRLQMRSWQDREGNKRRSAEVVADRIYFGDSKGSSSQGNGGGDYAPPANGGAPQGSGYMPPANGGAPQGNGYMPPANGGAPRGGSYMPPANGGAPQGNGYMPPTNGGAPQGSGYMPPANGSAPQGNGYMPPANSSAPRGSSYMPPANGGAPQGSGYMPPANGGAPQGNMPQNGYASRQGSGPSYQAAQSAIAAGPPAQNGNGFNAPVDPGYGNYSQDSGDLPF